MKKLFAMLALAVFSLAMTGCNNPKPDPDPAALTLAADKTTVSPGDQIIFTISGDLTGKTIGLCDYESCKIITEKISGGKYTYVVPANAKIGTFDFYAQETVTQTKTNYVAITIKAK